jgi:hypothetical protein
MNQSIKKAFLQFLGVRSRDVMHMELNLVFKWGMEFFELKKSFQNQNHNVENFEETKLKLPSKKNLPMLFSMLKTWTKGSLEKKKNHLMLV